MPIDFKFFAPQPESTSAGYQVLSQGAAARTEAASHMLDPLISAIRDSQHRALQAKELDLRAKAQATESAYQAGQLEVAKGHLELQREKQKIELGAQGIMANIYGGMQGGAAGGTTSAGEQVLGQSGHPRRPSAAELGGLPPAAQQEVMTTYENEEAKATARDQAQQKLEATKADLAAQEGAANELYGRLKKQPNVDSEAIDDIEAARTRRDYPKMMEKMVAEGTRAAAMSGFKTRLKELLKDDRERYKGDAKATGRLKEIEETAGLFHDPEKGAEHVTSQLAALNAERDARAAKEADASPYQFLKGDQEFKAGGTVEGASPPLKARVQSEAISQANKAHNDIVASFMQLSPEEQKSASVLQDLGEKLKANTPAAWEERIWAGGDPSSGKGFTHKQDRAAASSTSDQDASTGIDPATGKPTGGAVEADMTGALPIEAQKAAFDASRSGGKDAAAAALKDMRDKRRAEIEKRIANVDGSVTAKEWDDANPEPGMTGTSPSQRKRDLLWQKEHPGQGQLAQWREWKAAREQDRGKFPKEWSHPATKGKPK